MRSLSTSSCEQSNKSSSREESPSPQTPLDAGASFVHNAIANMNYRKYATAVNHPCCILYFYTPSFSSIPKTARCPPPGQAMFANQPNALFAMYLLLFMSCYPPSPFLHHVVFTFMPPFSRLAVFCVTTVALWNCHPPP